MAGTLSLGDFKAAARDHQIDFRVQVLQVSASRYPTHLSRRAAAAGLNYIDDPGVRALLQSRFDAKWGELPDKRLHKDMLRSEHIPLNFFGPISTVRARCIAKSWVESVLGTPIKCVDRVDIEFWPRPRARFLDDRTSFDAVVWYQHLGGQPGMVGVEMKYTEGPYEWGVTERRCMFSKRSRYNVVHERAEIYKAKAREDLRTTKLKQFWRNQLLGESMLQEQCTNLQNYVFVLLYPARHQHLSECATSYGKLLKTAHQGRFHALTYEKFIESVEESARRCDGPDWPRAWTNYLRRRYLFS